jgi:hypothetical protein
MEEYRSRSGSRSGSGGSVTYGYTSRGQPANPFAIFLFIMIWVFVAAMIILYGKEKMSAGFSPISLFANY